MRNFAVLLASTALMSVAAVPVGFNTNAGSKIYICATPQNLDIPQGTYEVLTWVEIKGIGTRGEQGKTTNFVEYPTWDTTIVQQAKGMTRGGTPTLDLARIPSDPGQILLRAAAAVGNNNNYAFKELRNDGTTSSNGTVIYNRGLVGGPTRPGGGNEDIDIERFTLAFQQEEIVVNPLAGGIPPTSTVVPVITGTVTVGQTLSLSNGTFTGDAVITYAYQWFAGGVAIPGAVLNTFVITSAQQGKIITGRVHATNASGSAIATSAPTVAVP